MGLGVAGLAVMGLGGLFIILKAIFAPGAIMTAASISEAAISISHTETSSEPMPMKLLIFLRKA